MRFSWEDDLVAVYSGKTLLASYYLPDPAMLEEDEEIEESITIEGGQKISFLVSLSGGADSDISGVVRVGYEESNAIRIATRQAQRLFYQANEVIRSILNPKWPRPCTPVLGQENYHSGGVIVRNVFTQTMPVLSSVLAATLVLVVIFHCAISPPPSTSKGDLSRMHGGPVSVQNTNAGREKTVNIKSPPDRPVRRDHIIKPSLPKSGRDKVRQVTDGRHTVDMGDDGFVVQISLSGNNLSFPAVQ